MPVSIPAHALDTSKVIAVSAPISFAIMDAKEGSMYIRVPCLLRVMELEMITSSSPGA
ncbi:Uncharacterised protein [Mycobacteroides abscessus subsp. abscessus]|nr:Uncharacterised protein [Mycobacteroides abscessus subsp. abscessus]